MEPRERRRRRRGTAHAYGVGLAVVGLFTTSLFVTHALLQVPAGRLCDRFGARLVGGTGLLIVAAASRPRSLAGPVVRDRHARLVGGVGTAAAFVAGSDYIRKTIGSPVAQGLYGACSVGSVGLALALVPLWGTWQAPFATAVDRRARRRSAGRAAPREPVARRRRAWLPRVTDRRLLPLAAMHCRVVRAVGRSSATGSSRCSTARAATRSSVAGSPAASCCSSASSPGRSVAGWSTGRRCFAELPRRGPGRGARGSRSRCRSRSRPPLSSGSLPGCRSRRVRRRGAAAAGAPGAAIGFVNMIAAVTILVGTPLVGLTFSLPGNGRIGFLVVAALCCVTAAVARARV